MPVSQPTVLPLDEHNQTLVNNTHPPGWQNPEPQGRYNLVVIGAGTAGLVSAAGAAALGARVAMIERHLLGGDCLVYGCVPSKALIRASRAAYESANSGDFGVHHSNFPNFPNFPNLTNPANPPHLEFGEAMERMRRLRSQISFHDSAQRFTKLGVEVFLGQAKFISRNAVEVEGSRLEFSQAILANGARAAALPAPGLKEAGYLTNETIFSLTRCPASLIVIGAGPVGCELAQAFRRFGAEVSIVNLDSQVLPHEDADAASLLHQQFKREGIRTFLGAQIRRVETGTGKTVVFDRGHGEEQITAEEILVAVGRAPNIEGLNLEAAGVQYHAKGVSVDDHLRTSNPNIYAAGDICSPYQFTHAAEALARIALQNALFFGRKKASGLILPWCTYTDPEIAHVGLYEGEAQKRGLKVETITLNMDGNDRAIVDGETQGFLRVHFNPQRGGEILGATLVSKHAGESISELVLAMQQKLKVSELGGILHPYPTQAEIIKRLGDAAMRTRLKPWMRKLLKKIFSLRR